MLSRCLHPFAKEHISLHTYLKARDGGLASCCQCTIDPGNNGVISNLLPITQFLQDIQSVPVGRWERWMDQYEEVLLVSNGGTQSQGENQRTVTISIISAEICQTAQEASAQTHCGAFLGGTSSSAATARPASACGSPHADPVQRRPPMRTWLGSSRAPLHSYSSPAVGYRVSVTVINPFASRDIIIFCCLG